MTSKLLRIATVMSILAIPASATLVDSPVSGSLTFDGDPSNYFDPGYGFVPSAYLNSTGTTVTVSETAIEFGFNDGSSLIAADFFDNRLVVSDLIETPGASNSFRMRFTDAAFAGQYLMPASDSFPLDLHSITGDTIMLDYPGGNPTTGQTLTASFVVAPVPEPSTIGFFSIAAFAGLAVIKKMRTPAVK